MTMMMMHITQNELRLLFTDININCGYSHVFLLCLPALSLS